MAEAFSMEALEKLLKSLQGTGSEEAAAKNQSKAQQQLAKLNGEIQKQIAQMQIQAQQAMQQQQAATSMAELLAKQNFEKPFTEAGLTGFYNGNNTLPRDQLMTSIDQFNRSHALESEIERGKMSLAQLTEEHQNAIATGQLDLAREIQTRQQALEEQIQTQESELNYMKTSGYMDNGQLTEEARAQRRQEAIAQAQTTGFYVPSYAEVVPEGTIGNYGYNDERSYNEAVRLSQQDGSYSGGQMTDAAQQWRVNAGLDYAKTAAAMSQTPEDYFLSAAYMRNAGQTGALGFLDAVNQQGLGSSVGFRTAGGPTPRTNSMANVAAGGQTNVQGGPAPQPNMGVAVDMEQAQPEMQMKVGIPGEQPVPQFVTDTGQQMFAGGGGRFDERAGRPITGRGAAPSDGPSPSLTQAAAANDGNAQVYKTQMYKPPAPQPTVAQTTGAQAQNGGQVQTPGFIQTNRPQAPAAVNSQSAIPGGVTDVAAQRLAAFQPIFQRGAHKLAPGALEALSPTERGLLTSAAKASGINPADFEQTYKRSHTFNTESAGRV